MRDVYEDFALPGSFSITAITLNSRGDTIICSRNLDFYQYRVLKRIEEEGQQRWEESVEHRGPFIDRKVNRIFICAALYDQSMSPP